MSHARSIDPKNQVASEIVKFRRELRTEITHAMTLLKKRNLICSLNSILLDWSIVGVGVYLAKASIAFVPLALIFIGSRQRALSNLVHDASHGNLAKSRKLNDTLANFFAALPMMDSVTNYRSSHMEHHRFLGQPVLDPDFENHRRYGFDDLKPPQGEAVKTYCRLLLNRQTWKDSVIGSVNTLSVNDLVRIGLWWTTITATLFFFDSRLALLSLGLWWTARMSTYHCIRIFAEFLDHSGLKPGSVFSYTRNIPSASRLLVFLFHPHADNFHLVHHLLPQIPHYHLKQAHQALTENQKYQDSHHCDGYFIGNYPAMKSWAYGGRSS